MTHSQAVPEAMTRRQVLIVFSGLVLAMLLAALDSTIVATALPTIVGELGGLERLGWVVTAYLLAQTIVTPLYGKLGDLYGRKIVLQSGIVLFLAGSVLCGLSGSMMQLIVFRFIQGLGGGGLMVTTQAVIGDIVPPRERGRYQGIFGAVFGVSSIAGPLLGGYFTTHLSWRWIFYINVPLGAIAMFVIAATLPRRTERVQHAIDYAGAALLAVALSAIVLVMDLGGTAWAWSSPMIIGLSALAAASLGAFVLVEHRAAEPVLPLQLFRNRTFALNSMIGLIVGLALFGSVTYLPLYLQVVGGASPTASGLQMLPLMGGMLVTSILSGQAISRSGRYRAFPIAGTATIAIGLFLLSRMDAHTSLGLAMLYMAILGAGLGLVMQVLVIAVQNAVDYRELGVATSGTTLFRLIGGSLGTAVFGALFASRVTRALAGSLPDGSQPIAAGGMSPESIAALPPALRTIYLDAFATSLGSVFLIAAVVALVGFVLAWLVPEHRLRETIAASAGDVGREAESIFPLPSDATSLFRIERALSLIATRDVRREYIQRVIDRAGLDMSPAAAWLLVRFHDDPATDEAALARQYDVPADLLAAAALELERQGLIRQDRALTPAGLDTLQRMVDVRRELLAAVLADWSPDRRDALALQVDALTHGLVPDAGEPRSG